MSHCKIIEQKSALSIDGYDHVVVCAPKPSKKSAVTKEVPKGYSKLISKFLDRHLKDWEDNTPYTFNVSPELTCTYMTVDLSKSVFNLLGLARKCAEAYKDAKKILIDVAELKEQHAIVDAMIAAHFAAHEYQRPVQKSKKTPHVKKSLHLRCQADRELKNLIHKTELSAAGTNLVRELVETPANFMDCKILRARAQQEAKEVGAKFEFIDRKKLAAMDAEAFLAVARGSDHHDAGIVKLSYGAKNAKTPHLVLVGKGVVYDTGGTNLKPAMYMFGMQGDMGGSALALALFKTIILQKLPLRLTCYLAISDNAIDAKAYRPNEVVKTVKGTTIETVHTDAEGRMLLVDTLSIASKDEYDLLMDFATLTGACIAAIGTTYCGVFSNQDKLYSDLIAAGKKSGERIWPFPMDEDFYEPLKSDIADVKQCLLKGGVDHIEAAQLLQQFVRKDKPWVHLDLSAAEHEGGLAHIPEKVTGFGVRVALEFINHHLLSKQ